MRGFAIARVPGDNAVIRIAVNVWHELSTIFECPMCPIIIEHALIGPGVADALSVPPVSVSWKRSPSGRNLLDERFVRFVDHALEKKKERDRAG